MTTDYNIFRWSRDHRYRVVQTKQQEIEVVAMPVPSEFFGGLPLLAEVDIWDPPTQYRTLPEAAKGRFDFHRGERYSVVVLASGTLADMKVVAE